MKYYHSSSSNITYIDNNNHKIQLIKNSIDNNNNKEFNATYKEIDHRQGKNIEKNFTNERQLHNFLGNKVIDNNHSILKKKSKRKLKKSIKKRRVK